MGDLTTLFGFDMFIDTQEKANKKEQGSDHNRSFLGNCYLNHPKINWWEKTLGYYVGETKVEFSTKK